ncbi:MAG: GIY-YIG nuclease family protein [Candidatus Zambryskibacteria bacterium]|nr:GIY-YIG nuclease family protein [Candidatus Zambryskibacteria bacterium]
MFKVYVIQNSDNGRIYIGQTENLIKRLKYHNGTKTSKKKSFTSKNTGKGVWNVVYSEDFGTRTEAMKREKELKNSGGRSFVKSKIYRP